MLLGPSLERVSIRASGGSEDVREAGDAAEDCFGREGVVSGTTMKEPSMRTDVDAAGVPAQMQGYQ